MRIVKTVAELRETLSSHRHPALVTTMGNLHAGHMQLIAQAKLLGDVTVASIFVNRLQFLPHEDFDTYPRTFESDCDKLEDIGCDVLFAPEEHELYPQRQGYTVHPPGAIADILEGQFRPGFFVGVSTVVMKLFSCVQPRVVVFGKKDYQQLMIVRGMVEQFALPIDVIGGETQRAEDGLALSSRNRYLSDLERAEAVHLSLVLRDLSRQVADGVDVEAAEAQSMAALAQRGWSPDYLTVRRRADLQPPRIGDVPGALVVLGAARLGTTRLIDNLEF